MDQRAAQLGCAEECGEWAQIETPHCTGDSPGFVRCGAGAAWFGYRSLAARNAMFLKQILVIFKIILSTRADSFTMPVFKVISRITNAPFFAIFY